MTSGYRANDNMPEKKREHFWGWYITNTKAFWPQRLSGKQMSNAWWGLESRLFQSLKEGRELKSTSSQIQKLYRKNILDCDNSGTTSGIHGMWSFVILLRRGFTPCMEAVWGWVFTLGEAWVPSLPVAPHPTIFPQLFICRPTVCSLLSQPQGCSTSIKICREQLISLLLFSTCQHHLHNNS